MTQVPVPDITAEQLDAAREHALSRIRAATQRKDEATLQTQAARDAQRQQLATTPDTARQVQRATELSPTSIATARARYGSDNQQPPATLAELQQATARVADAVAAEQQARADWRALLLTEHRRRLLRPLEIYRAANITKQMFSKILAESGRRDQPTPATTTLPPTAVLLP